jgi:hypothetical protein
MRLFRKPCGTALFLGLAFGLEGALSGCDAGNAKTEYKPIETNILKKLNAGGSPQREAAQAKLLAPVKKRK